MNKGVILLSAHFGNWEYVAASASLQVDLPFHVVVKPQRNPYVTNWLNKMRTKWNNKVISLGISIREIYKNLKEKNLIAMVADQRGPYEGIRVNFFGIKTAVYSGTAALALKTKAPIIYGITVRQPDYSYNVVLEEISMENLPENEEDRIIELSQRHTSYLEKFIRQYPEQWLWMHKRWKY
jgi:KDO2-lipid IV(A) lauroyltransferase